MARGYTAEYIQWLEDNNFSEADEKLILRTTTNRMLLWLLLSCIPGFGMFVLPLLMNAWSWRLIMKRKSFEPRPGLLYGFFSLAMYITFLFIIPWIIWGVVKRGRWGCGIRGLIRKGKIGNGARVSTAESDPSQPSAPVRRYQDAKKRFPWAILVVILVVIAGLILVVSLLNRKEPMQNTQTVVLENYAGAHVDTVTTALENLGIRYEITYITDPSQTPGTVIRHDPGAGTALALISRVELVVVRDAAVVPDFSAATSVEELQALADRHGLQLALIYANPEAGLTFDSIPEGMVIERMECNYAPGTALEPGSEVTVTVCLKPQYQLTGHWYNAGYTYGSLSLTQYYFGEDGTFRYSYMSYMAVDYETELYTYGTYWDGAMGSDDRSGTYQLSGDQLTLSYDFYNWETDAMDHATLTYQISISDGMLHLSRDDLGFSTSYSPGTQPDRDAVIPFSISGSWYALGTPVSNDFGGQSLSVHTFYLWDNGSFKSNRYAYLNSGDGWYFPGAGSTLVGTYSFDGTNLVLHYTAELLPVYDDNGSIIDSESIPMDETHTLVLTVTDGEVTAVAHDSIGLRCMIRVDPSPYVNVDIMGAPLEHANQLYP